MASRYWVGGTAIWNATATGKWSTTSGGAAGAALPTNTDDVFFDANSGAGTVTLSGTRVCQSIDFTGFTGTFAFSTGTLNVGQAVAGICKFVAGMTVSVGTGTLGFASSQSLSLQALTTAGKTMPAIVIATGPLTFMQLQDDLVTASTITITSGSLDFNGHNATCSGFSSSNANGRGLLNTPGTAVTFDVGNSWNTSTITNWTDSLGSQVTILFSTASACTFSSGAFAFGHNVTVAANATLTWTLTGDCSFGGLTVNPPATVKFTVAFVATFTAMTLNGTVSNAITMSSATAGQQATVSVASGLISGDYIVMQDLAGNGGAQFFAGVHSTNNGNNSGWSFFNPPRVIPRRHRFAVARASGY